MTLCKLWPSGLQRWLLAMKWLSTLVASCDLLGFSDDSWLWSDLATIGCKSCDLLGFSDVMITASDLTFRASATAGYEVLSRASYQLQSSTYLLHLVCLLWCMNWVYCFLNSYACIYRMPTAKLSSFTASCCCLICCLSCVCAQCIIHKHLCPEVIYDGQRAVIACIKEKERL